MKKFLKKIAYGLLGLLVILFIISLLLPTQQRVEASVKINAPVQLAFNEVNDLRNWESWSPWKTMDPMIELSYSNPPSGAGAFMNWKSIDPRIGNGKLILVEVIPNNKIVTAMDFEGRQNSSAEFLFEEEKNDVKVTWGMTHHIGRNPIGKYTMLFRKGALRKMFQRGLVSIKVKLETR